jgi:hypothetical protein
MSKSKAGATVAATAMVLAGSLSEPVSAGTHERVLSNGHYAASKVTNVDGVYQDGWRSHTIGEVQNMFLPWDIICNYQAQRAWIPENDSVDVIVETTRYNAGCSVGGAYFDFKDKNMPEVYDLRGKWKSNHTGGDMYVLGTHNG